MGETIGKGVTCERSQRGDDLDWDIRERQVLLGFQICVLGRVKRRAYSSIKFHRLTPYFSHGPLQVETCLYRIGIFSIIFQPSYTLCDPNDAYQHCPGIAPSLFASADGSHSLMGLLFRRCFLVKKKSGGGVCTFGDRIVFIPLLGRFEMDYLSQVIYYLLLLK